MSEQVKKNQRLAQLAQLQPPEWIREMRAYFRLHGTYRAEDVARLRAESAGTSHPVTQKRKKSPSTHELLEQMARTRR